MAGDGFTRADVTGACTVTCLRHKHRQMFTQAKYPRPATLTDAAEELPAFRAAPYIEG